MDIPLNEHDLKKLLSDHAELLKEKIKLLDQEISILKDTEIALLYEQTSLMKAISHIGSGATLTNLEIESFPPTKYALLINYITKNFKSIDAFAATLDTDVEMVKRHIDTRFPNLTGWLNKQLNRKKILLA